MHSSFLRETTKHFVDMIVRRVVYIPAVTQRLVTHVGRNLRVCVLCPPTIRTEARRNRVAGKPGGGGCVLCVSAAFYATYVGESTHAAKRRVFRCTLAVFSWWLVRTGNRWMDAWYLTAFPRQGNREPVARKPSKLDIFQLNRPLGSLGKPCRPSWPRSILSLFKGHFLVIWSTLRRNGTCAYMRKLEPHVVDKQVGGVFAGLQRKRLSSVQYCKQQCGGARRLH